MTQGTPGSSLEGNGKAACRSNAGVERTTSGYYVALGLQTSPSTPAPLALCACVSTLRASTHSFIHSGMFTAPVLCQALIPLRDTAMKNKYLTLLEIVF